MTKKKQKIKNSPFNLEDYTLKSLDESWEVISKLAKEKYALTWHDPHFEIVSFEDMLHIYTGSLPICYDHWSFGKRYQELYAQYSKDRLSIAYEVIFNTSPALCYLLEHNSPSMQGLTQAHAAIGHSSFFKNNCVFKEFTNAGTIIPFLQKSTQYIAECEEKYGISEVADVLDVCHAFSLYAIDRSLVPEKSAKERENLRIQRAITKEKEYDVLADTLTTQNLELPKKLSNYRLHEENILKFVAKFSPSLKGWQRDIINIYCKIQQYLYPQMLTKMMNEGWASFWHYTLMNDLIDMGYIEENGSIEFLHSHCAVLRQPDYDEKGYGGINPYRLGFEIFKDIKRICTNPTDEDKEWFPELVGKDWLEQVKFAAYNFKDESFILQYLSPKVIRDFKLFVVEDNEDSEYLKISDIQDDEGYKRIRSKLAKSYNFVNRIPDLYIEGWDAKKSRSLYLCFAEKDSARLETNSAEECFRLLKRLWRFPIVLKWFHSNGEVSEYREEKN